MADERTCSGPTCEARVLWVRNVKTGAKLIVDVEELKPGELTPGCVGVLGERGKVLRKEDLTEDGRLTEEVAKRAHPETTWHMTHWATCADREHFADRVGR